MSNIVTAYVIFNVTQNKYIFKGAKYSSGRKYLVYGDLSSARRMLNILKRYDFENDELRIVEMIPKEEKLGWFNEKDM